MPIHFEIVASGDALVLVLEGDAGQTLVVSVPVRTGNEVHALRDRILNAESQQTYEAILDALEGKSVFPFHWEATIDSGTLHDFAFASQPGKPGFEIFFREDKNQHYFHFNGADGVVILNSRGFVPGTLRDKRLRAVAEGANVLQRFEKLEAKAEGFDLFYEGEDLVLLGSLVPRAAAWPRADGAAHGTRGTECVASRRSVIEADYTV